MTDIGELVVRIKADATQLQQEMTKASATVKQSAGEMESAVEGLKGQLLELVPALSLGAIVEFTKGALEAADNLYIMAQRTGFASDTLSALNVPLKQNGSSIEEFSGSIKFMNRNIELAAEGNQELIQRFDSLGLSVTALKQLTPEEQFFAIAKALGQVTDQGKFTADGWAILGRTFASVAPLIKETTGNLADLIEEQKRQQNTLTKEEIDKVHAYEDAWVSFYEHLKIKSVEATLFMRDYFSEMAKGLTVTDAQLDATSGKGPNPNVSTARPQTVDQAKFLTELSRGDEVGPDKSGKGSNADLLDSDEEKQAAEQLQPYIDKLGEEAQAAEVSQKALFIKRTEIEATTKAQNDYNNGLRDSQDLTAEEITQVDAAAAALYDHKEALAQNKQVADQLTNSLTKIITNFKDMKSAITDLFESIAQEIIKTNIAKPLASSITSALPSGGINSIFSSFSSVLGFADGGSPPVGVPSIVGENGPELFVPSQAGTIVPNGQLGGQSIIVQQTFNMQPGLPETVGVAIRQSAPQIAAMAHASVMQAIQSGGAESRIVGRRS